MKKIAQFVFARQMLVLVGLATSLAGCQTFGLGTSSVLVSTDHAQVSAAAAAVIAEDLVGRLAEIVGPGTGTVSLRPDDSAFALALETSLRNWGYAVAVDQKTDGETIIPVAYVIDVFEGSVLARLSTNTADLGRAYSLTNNGATPVSPLSVLQRG